MLPWGNLRRVQNALCPLQSRPLHSCYYMWYIHARLKMRLFNANFKIISLMRWCFFLMSRNSICATALFKCWILEKKLSSAFSHLGLTSKEIPQFKGYLAVEFQPARELGRRQNRLDSFFFLKFACFTFRSSWKQNFTGFFQPRCLTVLKHWILRETESRRCEVKPGTKTLRHSSFGMTEI